VGVVYLWYGLGICSEESKSTTKIWSLDNWLRFEPNALQMRAYSDTIPTPHHAGCDVKNVLSMRKSPDSQTSSPPRTAKQTPRLLVRKRTIPTEPPPLVDEI
jgi:hypothetical protein